MNINHKTKITLALQEFSWLLLGVSIFFLLIGVFSLVMEARMSKLTCQRTQPIQGRCELTMVNFLGQTSTINWQLSEIQEMEFYDDIYQVHLTTAENKIHLMPFYRSAGNPRRKSRHKIFVFNEIKGFFVDTRKKTLAIKEDDRGLGYLTGFCFIGGSFVMVIGRLVEIKKTRARKVLKRRK